MPFNPIPSNWLGAGYTLTTNVAGFNTNDATSNKLLTKLTTAEANASSGDIREIIFSMIESFYQAWISKAEADRPTKLNITRNGNALPNGNINYTYTFQLEVATTSLNVASET